MKLHLRCSVTVNCWLPTNTVISLMEQYKNVMVLGICGTDIDLVRTTPKGFQAFEVLKGPQRLS